MQIALLVIEYQPAGVATIRQMEQELHPASSGDLVSEVGPADDTGLHRFAQVLHATSG